MTGPAASTRRRVRVVLDTDIGTDIDDVVALTALLGSPTLHLLGVTTCYVDARLRARVASTLLQLAEVDVTVVPGRSTPVRPPPALLSRGIWEWHEGRGLLYDDVSTEEQEYRDGRRPRERPYEADDDVRAPQWISSVVRANEGVTIICIGPLTNVAAALQEDHNLATSGASLVVLGGCLVPGVDGPQYEHNFIADPGAVEVVLGSGLPITLATFNATQPCHLARDRLGAICPRDSTFSAAMHALMTVYFKVKDRTLTSMHDPVAVALTEDLSFGKLVTTRVFFDPATGATSLGPLAGGRDCTLALVESVDVARAEEYVYDRLRRACARGADG